MRIMLKNYCLLSMCIILAGCSWFHRYRPNIQQGNVYDKAAVERLKIGMSQDQVRYIMGTPVLNNTLEPNRWDYIYSFQPGGKPRHQKDVTVFFDQKGLLQRIEFSPMQVIKN